ncbi:hypothetical protein SY88_04765 [Clostridiales bacterium PH28_bin88]|nr:hypothetical protein SY88_04765 [Clostridiales bacterium PH28_bin88]
MDVGRLVIIRGAGDLASGIAHRLWHSGFHVMMLEQAQPTVIRRTVSFAEAVYEGKVTVEGLTAVLADNPAEAVRYMEAGQIPILVDPQGECMEVVCPRVLVDAIMAKKNLGTSIEQAPVVVATGPGFRAGVDAHAVVETQRGHYLGRVYLEGQATPNTGIPGEVGGFGAERLLRATGEGEFVTLKRIGDVVTAGETVALAGTLPVRAHIGGVLRGLLREGLRVSTGMKVGDVDPRAIPEHCFTISDKARSVAGGVLEAIMYFLYGPGLKR